MPRNAKLWGIREGEPRAARPCPHPVHPEGSLKFTEEVANFPPLAPQLIGRPRPCPHLPRGVLPRALLVKLPRSSRRPLLQKHSEKPHKQAWLMGPQGPSPLPALCPGASLLPHHLPTPGLPGDQGRGGGGSDGEGRAWCESWATAGPRGKGQVTRPFSPAHDLVGEQHSAHFGVLVLPLVDDGLGKGKEAPLKAKDKGPVAPAPGKSTPSNSLWGPRSAKRGLGAWIHQPGPPPESARGACLSTGRASWSQLCSLVREVPGPPGPRPGCRVP